MGIGELYWEEGKQHNGVPGIQGKLAEQRGLALLTHVLKYAGKGRG